VSDISHQAQTTDTDALSTPQTLKITLHCDTASTAENPTFSSYTAGVLALEWATPHACPRDGGDSSGGGSDEGDSGSGETSSGGMGFFGFMKLLFWVGFFGLLVYFAVGTFCTQSQPEQRAVLLGSYGV
jgi:hypothetical protein